MYPNERILGHHVDAILPALVHQISPGQYVDCKKPVDCTECFPKIMKRNRYLLARGDQHKRLSGLLREAYDRDVAEAQARRWAGRENDSPYGSHG